MSLPVGRHEDPTQVAVSFEADAEHVEDLALVPSRGRPDVAHRRCARVFPRQGHLEPQVGVGLVGHQVVDDAEVDGFRRVRFGRGPARWGRSGDLTAPLIDRRQVAEHPVAVVVFSRGPFQDPVELLLRDPGGGDPISGRLDDGGIFAETSPQRLDNRSVRRHP